jgi:uncharacterized protein (TIGR03437 family)
VGLRKPRRFPHLKYEVRFLAAVFLTGPLLAQSGATPGAPYYTPDSIANSASNTTALYAPNTFISIYGTNLAYGTAAIGPDDIRGGGLPTLLGNLGVRVVINQILGDLYYVSPTQVNVLIPTSLVAGPATVQLVDSGLAGPPVSIMLGTAAPALFQADALDVIATHGNGPVVTPASPAAKGETVVLYATGLGPTLPAAIPDQIATSAAPLANLADFRVLLNGSAVDAHLILYAGVTPGFAGLYQINLQLPSNAPTNPEIRIGFSTVMSPAGRILPVQ